VQGQLAGEELMAPDHVSSGARDVASVVVAMVSVAFAPFLVGTLSVQIGRSFAFAARDLAVAVAGYYLVSAALSPAGGRVVAAIGAGRALRLACLGSTAGLALAASAQSAATLIVALSLLGVPNALVQPASNQVLVAVGSTRLQALSFGLVQSAIPIATLISGVLLGLFGESSSWRAAIGWVVALTALGQLVVRGGRAHSRGVPAPRAERAVVPDATGRRLLAALVVSGLLASMAAATLPAFVASTGENHGVGPQAVAAAQIAGSLACITMRVATTLRAAHLAVAQLLLAMAGLLGLGTLGYLLVGAGTAWAFCFGVLLAYGCAWGWNGVYNLSVTRARPHRVARSTGLTQAGVFGGSALGPLAFAAAVHTHGYSAAWGVVALFAVLASLLMAAAGLHWRRVVPLGPEYEREKHEYTDQ